MEHEEAQHSQLSCYTFSEESLPYSGPQFPQQKKALGRMVGGGRNRQDWNNPWILPGLACPGIYQWVKSVLEGYGSMTTHYWPLPPGLQDRLANPVLLPSCLSLQPSLPWLPSLLRPLLLPPYFPPPLHSRPPPGAEEASARGASCEAGGSSGGIRKPSLGEGWGAGKSPPSWACWVVSGEMSVSRTSVQPHNSWVNGPVTSSHRISVAFLVEWRLSHSFVPSFIRHVLTECQRCAIGYFKPWWYTLNKKEKKALPTWSSHVSWGGWIINK